MGDFTFGYVLAEPTSETPSSEDSSYLWENAANYGALKIHYRALVQTEVTIVCNFGAAQSLVGLMLEDVNFASVTIEGNATDSWGSPSFSESFTISKNPEIQRYNVWCALTSFNYQYLRIKIPTQSPLDLLSVFRIGRRTFIETAIERSPAWGFTGGGSYPEPTVNEMKSGRREKISNGAYKIWSGDFTFELTTAEAADLWSLDSVEPDDYIAFYANFGDTSACCLCQKDTPLSINWPNYQMRNSNSITLREVV